MKKLLGLIFALFLLCSAVCAAEKSAGTTFSASFTSALTSSTFSSIALGASGTCDATTVAVEFKGSDP